VANSSIAACAAPEHVASAMPPNRTVHKPTDRMACHRWRTMGKFCRCHRHDRLISDAPRMNVRTARRSCIIIDSTPSTMPETSSIFVLNSWGLTAGGSKTEEIRAHGPVGVEGCSAMDITLLRRRLCRAGAQNFHTTASKRGEAGGYEDQEDQT